MSADNTQELPPIEIASDVVEHIDVSKRHPNPSQGRLEKWLKSLPSMPVRIEVQLPPRDAPRTPAPVGIPKMYRYTVVVASGPDMADELDRFTVTAESVRHARHFGIRFFNRRAKVSSGVVWLRADLDARDR